MAEDKMVGFVDHRSPGVKGRRKRPDSDEHVCVWHDFLLEKNEDALDAITNNAMAEATRFDRKFESLENKIEKLVTKWALGIILSMFMSVLGGVFALGVWQLDHIDQKLTSLSNGMVELIASVSIVATKQIGVLDELEKLAPEHRDLMNHMEETDRERKLRQELERLYDNGGESR